MVSSPHRREATQPRIAPLMEAESDMFELARADIHKKA